VSKQDKYKHNVTPCRVRVTLLSQKCNNTFSFLLLCDVYAAVNNTKVVSVAMEMQQSFSFVLLSSNVIFRTAANSINVLKS